MNCRTLLMSAGATALGLASTKPAATQTGHTLRFGYSLPEGSSLGSGGKVFAAEIARRTGGRYMIEQHPAAALGDEAKMLKDLQRGVLDLAFITGAQLPNLIVEVGVFNVPFVFKDADHARVMLDSPVGMCCLEKFRDKDLIGLAWGEHGMRQLTNSRRPINTPADLKGLKLGVPQSVVMMIGFEAFGADVSAVAFPVLVSALQAGQIDGQENPLATILPTKIWQVQQHLTLSNHIYDPAVILMSPEAHRALSETDQTAFAEAAKLAGFASRRHAAEVEAQGVETLRRSGVQVVDNIDRQQFLTAMAPATQKFESLLGTDLVRWVRNDG